MKKLNLKCIYLLAIITVFSIAVSAQQKPAAEDSKKPMSHDDCPMMKKSGPEAMDKMPGSAHAGHDKMVMENGEKAMGFSQTATTHRFLIMKVGGAIQVEANDAKDTENRDRIRMHLAEIAKQFQAGIFTTPFAVHGQIPPGVPAMDKLKANIMYTYEETENGARVRIMTKNRDALEAIYQFLKFQIEEHKTGDSEIPR